MSKRLLLSLVVLLVMGILLWLAISSKPASAPREGSPSADSPATVKAREQRNKPDTAQAESSESVADEQSAEAAGETSAPASRSMPTGRPVSAGRVGPELGPGLTPVAVMGNMRLAFRQFSSQFGANPVGNNPEITSALNGGNPKQVVFIDPEDGLRINERGELIDNWGTAFFFHQLSAKEMEIRSAGPDRRLWTSDDLVMK